MIFKAIFAILTALLLVLHSGCSSPPGGLGPSDAVQVGGRIVKVSRASAYRNGMPGGADRSLTVSVTVEETSGESLLDITLMTISVYHDMGAWYPAGAETRHLTSTPHIVSAVVRGGPEWPGGSVIDLNISVHSVEFGTLDLQANTKIQVAH